ncbi:MAG: Icc protein, partial [Porticoccaceae bacterium]
TSPVPTHLRQAVTELVQRDAKPACVLINGDLALKDGQSGDYSHFAELIAPLREAQIDTHLTLGNHDHRETFYEVMKDQRPESPPVESRHISVVQTRYANFFLLDSLQKTMVTQGTIGPKQRTWLATALDAHSDRPALIVTHHNPRLGGDPLHFPGGLIDSEELWDILASRRHVKAYIHGHIHDRGVAEHRGIHIVNTPATSYVADPKKSTTGWTQARFTPAGVTLTTRTTDESHPWNGQTKTLTWRS